MDISHSAVMEENHNTEVSLTCIESGNKMYVLVNERDVIRPKQGLNPQQEDYILGPFYNCSLASEVKIKLC